MIIKYNYYDDNFIDLLGLKPNTKYRNLFIIDRVIKKLYNKDISTAPYIPAFQESYEVINECFYNNLNNLLKRKLINIRNPLISDLSENYINQTTSDLSENSSFDPNIITHNTNIHHLKYNYEIIKKIRKSLEQKSSLKYILKYKNKGNVVKQVCI